MSIFAKGIKMKKYCRFLFLAAIISVIFCMTAFAATLNPKMNVDTSLNNTYISSNLILSGWSLNQSGVREVDIYLDNKLIGKASLSIIRTDVYNIYPSYNNKNSGFSADLKINTSLLTAGNHILKVVSVGNNKSTVSQSFTMIFCRAKMCIDKPVNNSTIYNSTAIVGWALNAAGTKQINILVDGKLFGKATYGSSRTDVNRVYPGYYGGINSGFSYNLNINSISSGKHIITVQSVDSNGKILSSQINITKASPILNVDTNLNNIYVQDTLSFSGWSLCSGGVKEVDVYLDKNLLGQAVIGGLRGDIANEYPGYNDADSGFTYSLTDPTKISSGIHTLTITSVGNDGSTVSKSYTINKMKPVTDIATPVKNTNCPNNIPLNISGWALNASGVAQINIYVDSLSSLPVGQATIGISSPNIDTSTNEIEYKNAGTSGYSYNLDISNLGNLGNHTVYVQAVGFDGETSVAQVTFSTASVTQYNLTLSAMIALEMKNTYDTTAMAVNGVWEYPEIKNGQEGYYVYNSSHNQVFTASNTQYNAIENQLSIDINPANLINDSIGKYEFLQCFGWSFVWSWSGFLKCGKSK
jgi:hypothetical protein